VLLAALVVFAGGAYSVYAAVSRRGAARVPAPAFTATPHRATGWGAARFAFIDRQAGVRFQCSLDGARFTRCASPTRLRALAAGRHTFRVRAVRGQKRHRERSRASAYSWLIDSRPPRPLIGERPSDPTNARSASFTFSDGEQGVTFQCSLDGNRWKACRSPASYRGLSLAEHWFRVRALDPPARPSVAAGLFWRVLAAEESGKDFSISAETSAGAALFPGAPPQTIPITLTNPNDTPIFVTSVTVTVLSSPPGCDAASNIRLIQSNVSEAAPVEIQARGSRRLPAQGRTAPTIQLVDLAVNQDACQKASFPLRFTGSSHS
jgi:hypothetical protein